MAGLWPAVAVAQQQNPLPMIGVLGAATPEARQVQLNLAAFREALAETGYIEGQNVAIEYRFAERRLERLNALAAELVARKVDVIVTEGGDPATIAAKDATSTILVVFHGSNDPVARGWAASFDRPGGNLTGVQLTVDEQMPKLLELLIEVVPQAKRIGLLSAPNSSFDLTATANAKSVHLDISPVVMDSEVDAAFAKFLEGQVQAVMIYGFGRARAAELASKHRLPTFALYRDLPEVGGLLSYGPSQTAVYRVKGIYTGRILKGEKAGDLPIERTKKQELVVNLKTAKALGIAVPQPVLARADQVIE
jgi:putative ABC transport system substrate-binding protein